MDNKSHRSDFDDDYFELLRRAAAEQELLETPSPKSAPRDRRHEGYEDVYSHSESFADEYEDISSYSSPERRAQDRRPASPVRPAAQRRPRPQAPSRPVQPAQSRRSARADTHKLPPVTAAVPPPARPAAFDEEEISDHDVRYRRTPGGKKPRKGRRVVSILVALLAVLLVLGIVFSSVALKFTSGFLEPEKITHYEGATLHRKSYVRNILLIGLDKSQGGVSRSDTIMLISLNSHTGKLTMTSIMRDTHVLIADSDEEAKINSAYARGKANCLLRTVEMNFGVYINDYALVDFDMFSELVEGLGGIKLKLTDSEADYINSLYASTFPEDEPSELTGGDNVFLTGRQALLYARIRKVSSDEFGDADFGRTGRQRYLLEAIFKKVRSSISPTGIPRLLKTADTVAPYVETTLTRSDLLRFGASFVGCYARAGFKADKLMVSQRIPFDGTWHYSQEWDGSSLAIDLEENRDLLYRTVYQGEDPFAEDAAEEESE